MNVKSEPDTEGWKAWILSPHNQQSGNSGNHATALQPSIAGK